MCLRDYARNGARREPAALDALFGKIDVSKQVSGFFVFLGIFPMGIFFKVGHFFPLMLWTMGMFQFDGVFTIFSDFSGFLS